jgi:hypothetical protein
MIFMSWMEGRFGPDHRPIGTISPTCLPSTITLRTGRLRDVLCLFS